MGITAAGDHEVQATFTMESGSEGTLKMACDAVRRAALDASRRMSPRDILELAASGKPSFVAGMPLLDEAANAASIMKALEAVHDVVEDANDKITSLLCRQILERALENELQREKQEAILLQDKAVAVFQLADADGSGSLTFGEVRMLAGDLDEAQFILEDLDQDNDGAIDVDEWVGYFAALYAAHPAAAHMLLERSVKLIFERNFMMTCADLFGAFDSDGSGALELAEIMQMVGDDEMGAAFASFLDVDGDKSVSLDEWLGFLMGFWRMHPMGARNMVANLMQRAAELATMPAMPPSKPAKGAGEVEVVRAPDGTIDRPATLAVVFAALDVDSNGSLDLSEFKAAMDAEVGAGSTADYYKWMDGNSDGGVSLEEWTASVLVTSEWDEDAEFEASVQAWTKLAAKAAA